MAGIPYCSRPVPVRWGASQRQAVPGVLSSRELSQYDAEIILRTQLNWEQGEHWEHKRKSAASGRYRMGTVREH